MAFNEYWEADRKRRAVAEAIAGLSTGDTEAHQRFYEALRASMLLLPVEQLPEGFRDGDLLVGQNIPIQVKMVKGPDEKVYLPVFTAEETLRKVHSEEQHHLVVPFNTLSQMALQAQAGGIVVDRGGPATASVQLAVLLSLSQGATREEGSAGGTAPGGKPRPGKMQVGPPPRVTDFEELAALSAWLREQSGVAQAYLFGLSQGTEQAVLTVGLSISTAPSPEQIQSMARELGEILGPSGIVIIDGRLATLLARQIGAIRFDLRKLR